MKRTILKALAVASGTPLLYLAGLSPDASSMLTLVSEAYAVVGAPATPMSVAGVARRTTVRAASASAAASQQAAATQQQQQAAVAQQQQAAAARPAGAPAAGTVVNALPAGCAPETRGGVEYQNCGGVLYRAGFQGTNLVYVVQ